MREVLLDSLTPADRGVIERVIETYPDLTVAEAIELSAEFGGLEMTTTAARKLLGPRLRPKRQVYRDAVALAKQRGEKVTKTYSIWYQTPKFWREKYTSAGAKPDPANLAATHVHVKDVVEREVSREDALERVFAAMQGEVWSPNGEARELIAAKGLEHTSMSAGDVIVVDGKTYFVRISGFELLER